MKMERQAKVADERFERRRRKLQLKRTHIQLCRKITLFSPNVASLREVSPPNSEQVLKTLRIITSSK